MIGVDFSVLWKRKVVRLVFDENERVDLNDLRIPDEHVISLSVEYFADPTPCEIHRGAVRARVLAEVEQFLKSGTGLMAEQLDENIRRHLSAYDFKQVRMEKG